MSRKSNAFLFLFILCAIVVIIGFLPLRSPAIGGLASRLAHQHGLDSCTMQGATLQLWRGISCQEVSFVKQIDSLTTLSVRCATVCGKFDLPTLLRLSFMQRSLNFFSRNDTSATLWQQLNNSPLRKGLRSLTFSDATSTIHKKGMVLLTISGAAGQISIPQDPAVMAQVDFSAEVLSGQGLSCTRVHGRATVDSIGTVSVESLKSKFLGGSIVAEGRINAHKKQLEGAKVSLSECSLSDWYSHFSADGGTIAGTLNAQMTFDTSLLLLGSLRAIGKVAIHEFRATQLPIQRSMSVALVLPMFSDVRFDLVEGRIGFHNGRFETTLINGKSRDLDITINGWLGTDATIYEEVSGAISAEAAESLSDIVKKSMTRDKKGRFTFKCTVKGSVSNPSVQLDKAIIDRAVNSLFDDLKKSFGGFFK